RVALLTTDALMLVVAARVGWRLSYGIYGALMGVGIVTTWFATEPTRAAVSAEKEREAPLWTPRGFFDAVVGPFTAFFRTHGWLAFLMLAAISLYRLPDFVMGPMANPFYHDIGLSKDVVGGVRASGGLVFSLLGVAAGGLSCVRMGYLKTLIAGARVRGRPVALFPILGYSGVPIG